MIRVGVGGWVYPEWRGYEFVQVHQQILVIDPATLEIVAILEA